MTESKKNTPIFFILVILILVAITAVIIFGFQLDVFTSPTPTLIPTPTQIAIKLHSVLDDHMIINVSLPSNWEDIDGGGIYEGDLFKVASLHASDNLTNFYSDLQTPGITITTFDLTKPEYNEEGNLISGIVIDDYMQDTLDSRIDDISQICLYYGRSQFENNSMIGYIDAFEDCVANNDQVKIYSIALTSKNEDFYSLSMIELRSTNEEINNLVPDILDSLNQVQSVNEENQALPDYDPYWSGENHNQYLQQYDQSKIISVSLPEEYQMNFSNIWYNFEENLPFGVLYYASPNMSRFMEEQGPGVLLGVSVYDYMGTEVIAARRNYYQNKYSCDVTDFGVVKQDKFNYWQYDVSNCEKTEANFRLITADPNNYFGTPYFVLIELTYYNDRDLTTLTNLYESLEIDSDLLFENDFIRFNGN